MCKLSRRTVVLLLAVVLCAAAGIWDLSRRPTDPVLGGRAGRALSAWVRDAEQTTDKGLRERALRILIAFSRSPDRSYRWQILNELFHIEPAATIPGLFEEMKYERRYVPIEPGSDDAPDGFAADALYHATMLNEWQKQPGYVTLSREDQLRSPQLWMIEIGPANRDLVPVLIENLFFAYDGGVNKYAANLLGKIGPKAKAAVPLLLEIIKAKNLTALEDAARAVVLIDGEQRPVVVSLLRDMANDEDAHVRQEAAIALKSLGEP